MKKYLTRRCIGLHASVLILVPAFLLAGWWQYHVALSGNDLSWVYTVEWPFFALYAVYIWWKLIHDEHTPFDRLWAAKQRAAADEEGRPLHEIPGWATDKGLSRAVHQASREAARHPGLSGPRLMSLEVQTRGRASLMPVSSHRVEDSGATSPPLKSRGDDDRGEDPEPVIDAEVLEVKVNVDQELEAYNRYLFDLSRSGPPKRWRPRRITSRDVAPGVHGTADPMSARRRSALPTNEED